MSKQIRIPLAEAEGLIREELAGGGSVVINVHGTSMLPLLKDGITNVRLVSPVFPLQNHQVILYKRPNGQFVLHRILKCRKDGLVCRGDHQTAKELAVKESSVIAVMSAYSKGERWVNVNALSARLAGAFLARTARPRWFVRAAWGKARCLIKGKRS